MPTQIFVSLASYRDPELPYTIQSAVANAAEPWNITFSVVDQIPADSPGNESLLSSWAQNLRYTRVDSQYARGACHARAIAQRMPISERYLLQIDSHMQFEKDWDFRLMAALEDAAVRSGHERVLISTYPRGYHRDSDGSVIVDHEPPGTALRMRPVNQDTTIDPVKPIVMFTSDPFKVEHVIPAMALAGGAMFTYTTFTRAIPYDEYLYFHGEEQTLYLRAFTRGWDMYHMPSIPLSHQYYTSAITRTRHWDVAEDLGRTFRWVSIEEQAMTRMRSILSGEIRGVYGLGSVRTLADYADISGIDYPNRTVKHHGFDPVFTWASLQSNTHAR